MVLYFFATEGSRTRGARSCSGLTPPTDSVVRAAGVASDVTLLPANAADFGVFAEPGNVAAPEAVIAHLVSPRPVVIDVPAFGTAAVAAVGAAVGAPVVPPAQVVDPVAQSLELL